MSTRHWNGRNAAYGGLLSHVIDTLKHSSALTDRQAGREPGGKRSPTAAFDCAGHELLRAAHRSGLLETLMPLTPAPNREPRRGQLASRPDAGASQPRGRS